MMNIVEKYSVEEAVGAEDGVVAIEYVMVAAAVIAALAGIWTVFGTSLDAKLQGLINLI